MRPQSRMALFTLLLLPMLALLYQGQVASVAAQAGARCFPETGFCISGRIREGAELILFDAGGNEVARFAAGL